jgi:hypothetical protein
VAPPTQDVARGRGYTPGKDKSSQNSPHRGRIHLGMALRTFGVATNQVLEAWMNSCTFQNCTFVCEKSLARFNTQAEQRRKGSGGGRGSQRDSQSWLLGGGGGWGNEH